MKRREFLQLSAGGAAAALFSRPAGAQAGYPDRASSLSCRAPPAALSTSSPANGAARSASRSAPSISRTWAAAAASSARPRRPVRRRTATRFCSAPTANSSSARCSGRRVYDPVASFEPIAILCDSPAAIVVHPTVPVSNLKELVAYSKQHKDRMNYGSAGAGTISNLAGELFKQLADVPEIVHIPYKGGGPAVADALRGSGPGLDADDVGAAFRVSQAGQAQDSGGGVRAAAFVDARHPDRRRAGLSRSGGAAVLRPVRAGEDAEGDHRQGRAGVAGLRCRIRR